jgi:CubicO group peptidase (beta-lactamase class C family)
LLPYGVTAVKRLPRLVLLVVLAAVTACSGRSLEPSVPPVHDAPADIAGFSWWKRAAIDAWLRYQVWSDTRSGFVVMLAKNGRPFYANAHGWEDIASRRPMTLDSRMRFASMTKPVTAVAALQLVESGRLSLDDPVADYLPEFAGVRVASGQSRDGAGEFVTEAASPAPTVRHLLMFASGIGPGMGEDSDLLLHWRDNGPRTPASGTMGERVAGLARLPLFEQPGTRWRYGWSADVLARVVEVASGQAFDAYLHERIFSPLGMNSTRFRFADPAPGQLATVYTQDADGALVVSQPDSDVDFPEGGSGLVSTAGDYLRFALMLWNRGEYLGARILEQETVDLMRAVHLPGGVLESQGIEGLGWGLGVSVVVDAEATPFGDRQGDYWWSGYFGTTFFVSPETGLVGVVLSQNEPGPHSDLPLGIYGVQTLAFLGL